MSSLTLTGAGPETAGGGGAFDPSTVAGLQAWFKADVGTSTTTDGAAVSQWNDQSGNARHLVQATGTSQPLYKAAIQNGKPVVRFDGVDDWMAVTFTLNQPATWFVVCVYRGAYAADSRVYDGAAAVTSNTLSRRSSTNVSIYANTAELLITTTPQSWHSYTGIFNGASSEFRVDGASTVTGNPGASNPGGITLGAQQNRTGGLFSDIDVGELLVYNTAVSAADRANVESYLRGRWATP